MAFIIFFVKFSCFSELALGLHQSCPRRGSPFGQAPGPALIQRSGDLSLPQVHFFSFSVSEEQGAAMLEPGPQPPLHHDRHLNLFPLLGFYTTFTAAQVFNSDQSLLLSPSFITLSFKLFFFFFPFLLILFSFTWTSPVAEQCIRLCSAAFSSHLFPPDLSRFHHLLRG